MVRRLWLAALALFGVPSTALAQFEINGVIHDAESLRPIEDVVVFVRSETDGTQISPGLLDPPTQQGQITGPNGRYSFKEMGRWAVIDVGALSLPETWWFEDASTSATKGPSCGVA